MSAPTSFPIRAEWYFDFISPFAYLQLEQFDRLPAGLDVTLRPVVLGALLAHWQNRGPAEIPGKRRFTYRYVQFRAEQLGIPLRMPPAHPFNPLRPLRLAQALGGGVEVVREIFRHLWRDGLGVADEAGWRTLCARLGVVDAETLIERAEVKAGLRQNTEAAIAREVFGVPTFAVGDDLFWGEDATAMLLHCLEFPDWLQSAELRRISELPVGVERRR